MAASKKYVVLICMFIAASSIRYVASSSSSASVCTSRCSPQSSKFIHDLQFQCPITISSYSPLEMDGKSLDRAFSSSHTHVYTAVLFYASGCPFSSVVQAKFAALSSMFPQIKHVIIEQSSAMPSIFSRYGIRSLPSILMVKRTTRVRHHGPKDPCSFVHFYKRTTGLDPVVDLIEDQGSYSDSGHKLLHSWKGNSLKEILMGDPYLVFSVMFLFFRVNTDADESMKKFVLASVGKKWREWKARVKQMGYTPFNNDADRLTHRPETVHEHQWRSLVYYWGTRKAQKKSTKNKEIRKKKTLNHITGRKPFSVVRVEETNKKNGVPATRLEVWMAGYSEDNKPSNDKVAEVMIDAKYSDDSSFKYTYLTTKMETRSSKVSCILSENPTTKMEEYNIAMKKMMRNHYEYHHDLGMNYTLITDKLIVGSQPQKPEDIDHLKREEDVAYIKMLICVHQMLYSSILLLQFYYYYFGSVLITGKPDDVCFCLNELDDSPVDAILMLLVIF